MPLRLNSGRDLQPNRGHDGFPTPKESFLPPIRGASQHARVVPIDNNDADFKQKLIDALVKKSVEDERQVQKLDTQVFEQKKRLN